MDLEAELAAIERGQVKAQGALVTRIELRIIDPADPSQPIDVMWLHMDILAPGRPWP